MAKPGHASASHRYRIKKKAIDPNFKVEEATRSAKRYANLSEAVRKQRLQQMKEYSQERRKKLKAVSAAAVLPLLPVQDAHLPSETISIAPIPVTTGLISALPIPPLPPPPMIPPLVQVQAPMTTGPEEHTSSQPPPTMVPPPIQNQAPATTGPEGQTHSQPPPPMIPPLVQVQAPMTTGPEEHTPSQPPPPLVPPPLQNQAPATTGPEGQTHSQPPPPMIPPLVQVQAPMTTGPEGQTHSQPPPPLVPPPLQNQAPATTGPEGQTHSQPPPPLVPPPLQNQAPATTGPEGQTHSQPPPPLVPPPLQNQAPATTGPEGQTHSQPPPPLVPPPLQNQAPATTGPEGQTHSQPPPPLVPPPLQNQAPATTGPEGQTHSQPPPPLVPPPIQNQAPATTGPEEQTHSQPPPPLVPPPLQNQAPATTGPEGQTHSQPPPPLVPPPLQNQAPATTGPEGQTHSQPPPPLVPPPIQNQAPATTGPEGQTHSQPPPPLVPPPIQNQAPATTGLEGQTHSQPPPPLIPPSVQVQASISKGPEEETPSRPQIPGTTSSPDTGPQAPRRPRTRFSRHISASPTVLPPRQSASKTDVARRQKTGRAVSRAHRLIEMLEKRDKTHQEKIKNQEKLIGKLRKQNQRMRKKKADNPGKTSVSRKKAESDLRAAGLAPPRHPNLMKRLTAHHAICDQLKSNNIKNKTLTKKSAEALVRSNIVRSAKCISYIANKTFTNRNCTTKNPSQPKQRQPELHREQREHIHQFFHRDDVSRVQPGQNDYTKLPSGEKVQTRILNDYLKNLHKKYCIEFPGKKICRALFCSLRPKNVKLAQFTNKIECLCIYHQNIALKLKALNISSTPDHAVKEYTDEELMSRVPATGPVKYYMWERVKEKETLSTKCLEKSDTPRAFKEKLRAEIRQFHGHVNRVNTQFSAQQDLKASLKDGEVVIHMDFAENYTCKAPNAVQSSYWTPPQLSLHPAVIYSRAADGSIQHESHVYMSASTAHSPTTVVAILQKLNVMLSPLDLDCIHYVTDGPSSQYRNRTICHIVGNHKFYFGCEATWTYHEVGHGKGPCDGIGGTIKRKMKDATNQDKANIQSIDDALKFLSEQDSTIKVYSYDDTALEEAAELIKEADPASVPGIAAIHALIPGASPGTLLMRETSCFCQGCRSGNLCNGWKSAPIKVQENAVPKNPIYTTKGRFMAVLYKGKSGETYYMGQVVKDEPKRKKSQVSLMVQSTFNPQLFRWPDKPEEPFVIRYNKMICNVDLQLLKRGPRSSDIYQISTEILEKVRQLHADKLMEE